MTTPVDKYVPAPVPVAESSAPRPGMKRRWLFAILALVLLFVLMPFLFWQATWFGRPLTDSQIAEYLDPTARPRDTQHALAQIEQRIESPNAAVSDSARAWYPDIIRISTQGGPELRLTAAWVMGQDNTAPEFHQALLHLLTDPDPMVRRNAALGLVRFADSAGHDEILAMLSPTTLASPAAGVLSIRVKTGDTVNPGTMVARVTSGDQKIELRSQMPGTAGPWLVTDGAQVTAAEPLLVLDPSSDMVWESLRALYLIGQPSDLSAVISYTHPPADFPASIAQQAAATAAAIRSRAQH
ncbi:MAG: HEAT repeat domain-containing protein [Candidatus Acidiferrales bacterium]